MRSLYTVLLLVLSNTFMTLAWYGHLKFKQIPALKEIGLHWVILIAWGIALLEYIFQVPANRLGYNGNGGPFSLMQLKIIQEVITLLVFVGFSLLVFKNEVIRWNHIMAFICIIMAVYFVFKK